MLLSIIVLARNEEKNIRACLDSIFAAAQISDKEVIVVDSNSQDKTLEYARKYDVRIMHIPSDEYSSPAAGVYVGVKRSKGRFVHIVGGDFIVAKDWFDGLFELFREEKRLALLTGTRKQKSRKSKYSKAVQAKFSSDRIGIVPMAGGGGTFRGDVLRKHGNINPWIGYFEEPIISVNLRQKGYILRRINKLMFTHVDKPRNLKHSMQRTYIGARDAGRALRQYVFDRRFKMLVEILRNYGRSKGPRKKALVYSLAQMGVSAFGIFYGFVIGARKPSEYPLSKVKELKL